MLRYASPTPTPRTDEPPPAPRRGPNHMTDFEIWRLEVVQAEIATMKAAYLELVATGQLAPEIWEHIFKHL